MYLERKQPSQFADIIVVNHDFENPQLLMAPNRAFEATGR
jgi:hypothetical protein